MLVSNNQLNELQLKSLDDLVALCLTNDEGAPTVYHHLLEQKRITDNNFLYFLRGKLIAFLSVYFFYETACEISLMVAPQHRRQGIAKKLVKTALPLLAAKQMETVIFSIPPSMDQDWLERCEFVYKNSEYKMIRQSFEPILINNPALNIRKARVSDIEDLSRMDEACFNAEASSMFERFQNLLNDDSYTILIALYQDIPVGKAHIRWHPDRAIFSDIAILPSHQKKGLGSELIADCINHALTLGKTQLILDVESSNQHALKLYTRNGFKIRNITNYWSLPLKKLRQLSNS